jgi:hypothetical protein
MSVRRRAAFLFCVQEVFVALSAVHVSVHLIVICYLELGCEFIIVVAPYIIKQDKFSPLILITHEKVVLHMHSC